MRGASGHIDGTTHGAEGAGESRLEGVFDGGLKGEGQVEATFVRTNGDELPTEMRWVDGRFYVKRTAATVPDNETLSLFARPDGAKPWRRFSITGFVPFLPAAFSPVALVDWLAQLRVPLEKGANEPVGDVDATRLTTTRKITVGVWVGATVDLWVDGENRVVRVRITAPTGGAQYDVEDYGAPVNVEAPPASDIASQSEVETPEPSGDFETVKSGVTNGVTWTFQDAPGTNGTVCTRWVATPPLPQPGLASPEAPQCARPLPATSEDPSELVDFSVHGDATGPYDALVVQLPAGVKRLTLGFVGGKTQELAPDRTVVWIGPTQPVKAYLGVTLADGTTMDCGAGAVASVADLTDPKITADVGAAPWGCIPPA
jgi:hypothetical protein